MALIKCPECGKEISDTADSCIGCGYKIAQNSNANNIEKNKKENKATVGFILGLCSILAWFIPLIGYPVTICGIVFCSNGLNSKKNKLAITGLILSIIFLVITLINSIAGAIMFSNVSSNIINNKSSNTSTKYNNYVYRK